MINYFDYNNNTYLIKLNCCITLILPEETTEFTTIEKNEEVVIDLYYKKNDIFIYNETQKKMSNIEFNEDITIKNRRNEENIISQNSEITSKYLINNMIIKLKIQ